MGGLFLILAAAAVYLFLIFPGQSAPEQREPFVHRNFGHRGLYDNEHGVPENSLAAFEAAMDAGYGCVSLCKDRRSYDRVAGVEAAGRRSRCI